MIKKMGVAASVMLLTVASAHANIKVDLKGSLLPPVCEVHDGNNGPIEVDFGDDININRIDGKNYKQDINYKLECGDDGQQWRLRFKFIGIVNSWDNLALVTSDNNLGIRLMLNDIAVDFNQEIPVDSNNLPKLEAVPVKNAATMPKEGVFNATANLLAEYY
ncbi:fimbrial protein [Acinetobacter vivianii]|uniref:Fimbrial protein n=1 Tax=Acinetobacter vivianii TaxID=1776742 RepID=A0AAJ6P5P9_9GAMM|nr:fimbrial protein [Acinetobacter vivianii]WDZ51803.1 fimbrial protein [Acinetobacter vivianii]